MGKDTFHCPRLSRASFSSVGDADGFELGLECCRALALLQDLLSGWTDRPKCPSLTAAVTDRAVFPAGKMA